MADASTGAPSKCMRCGQDHLIPACPEVKAIEFHEDGALRRVEFLTPADMLRDAAGEIAPIQQPYETLQPGWKR